MNGIDYVKIVGVCELFVFVFMKFGCLVEVMSLFERSAKIFVRVRGDGGAFAFVLMCLYFVEVV